MMEARISLQFLKADEGWIRVGSVQFVILQNMQPSGRKLSPCTQLIGDIAPQFSNMKELAFRYKTAFSGVLHFQVERLEPNLKICQPPNALS